MFAVALAFLVLAIMAPSNRAYADPVQAGPFMVDGASTSYSYDQDAEQLVISASGVTIASMADGWTGGNDIRLTGQGQGFVVNLGTDVNINAVTGTGPSSFNVTSTGNRIGSLQYATYFSGSGSVVIADVAGNIDSMGPNIIIEGKVSAEWQHQSGMVTLVPGASMNALVVLGGTLDLSQITLGSPVPVEGLTLGSSQTDINVIVPFGTDRIQQLATADNLFVQNPQRAHAFSDGEQVGYVQSDGTIYYTATRKVTFFGFDGQQLAAEEVRLFQPATAPEVTAPEGYRFVGWDTDFSRVSRNMNVLAMFEQVPSPDPEPSPEPGPNPNPETSDQVSFEQDGASGEAFHARTAPRTSDAAVFLAAMVFVLACVAGGGVFLARRRLRQRASRQK